MNVIQVEHLHKANKRATAFEDISYELQEGKNLGMVGPSDAGMTTTIECLEGLRQPNKGLISVMSSNPRTDKYALRKHTVCNSRNRCCHQPRRSRIDSCGR